jgi:hypothetical protein
MNSRYATRLNRILIAAVALGAGIFFSAAANADAGNALAAVNDKVTSSPYFEYLGAIDFPVTVAARQHAPLSDGDSLYQNSYRILGYLDYTRNYTAAGLYATEVALQALRDGRTKTAYMFMSYVRQLPAGALLQVADYDRGDEPIHRLERALDDSLSTFSSNFAEEAAPSFATASHTTPDLAAAQ